MDYFEDACETIDAALFTGDTLYDEKKRAMLKEYLGRWNRAVLAHETSSTEDTDG
jgi:hypothetical protein